MVGAEDGAYSSDDSNEEDYSEDANSIDYDSQEEEGEEDRLQMLQKELSQVPFEKLVEIQRDMGKKEFHKMHKSGASSTTTSNTTTNAAQDRRNQFQRKKRADKNMPVEVTAKKPVGRYREVVTIQKMEMRDPRFDKTAGKFNPQLFKQSYGFVAELQSNELAQHKERLSKLTGLKNLGPGQLEEKMKLEKVVQRLSSKMEGDKKKDFKNKIKTDWKKKERELVKNGKTPFFLKKSQLKKMELMEQFKEIKGKDMDRFLEKRRKRNSAKEKRTLPWKQNK